MSLASVHSDWQLVCSMDDLIPGSGVCAVIETTPGQRDQVALFLTSAAEPQLYAIGNFDPKGKANVLYRGLLGATGTCNYIASPLYKQRYSLEDGQCLDDEQLAVPCYATKIIDGQVFLKPSAGCQVDG